MTPFIPPKRKIFELLALPIFIGMFYLFSPVPEALTLFSFGYIWNWSASNDLSVLFQNKRYRMSMLKMVVNLQNLFLKLFNWAPALLKRFAKILPAGTFWAIVIFINESDMPWWPTFVGSTVFEILQFEISLLIKQKQDEQIPEIPKEIP
jgi:hypothetical protein